MTSTIATIALVALAAAIVILVIAISHLLFFRSRLRPGSVGSLAGGICIVIWGFLNFAFTRDRAQAHQPSYYKYGLVTPDQGYAATTGIFLFGSTVIIIALYPRHPTHKDPQPPQPSNQTMQLTAGRSVPQVEDDF